MAQSIYIYMSISTYMHMWMRHWLGQEIQKESDEKVDGGSTEIMSGVSGRNGIFEVSRADQVLVRAENMQDPFFYESYT